MIIGTLVVATVASLLSPAGRQAAIDARLAKDAERAKSDTE